MTKETTDYAPDVLIAREHVEITANGKLTMKSDGLKSIMDRHGATKEVIATYHTGMDYVYGASATILGEHLIEKIKETQAPGEDASGVAVHLSLPTKGGVTELTAEASRTFANRMGGEGAPDSVTRYGRLTVRIQTKRRIPKDVSASLAEAAETLLTGNKPAAKKDDAKIALPT